MEIIWHTSKEIFLVKFTSPYPEQKKSNFIKPIHNGDFAPEREKQGCLAKDVMFLPERIRCNWTNRLDFIALRICPWHVDGPRSHRSPAARRYWKNSSFVNFPMEPWTVLRWWLSKWQKVGNACLVLLKSPQSDSRCSLTCESEVTKSMSGKTWSSPPIPKSHCKTCSPPLKIPHWRGCLKVGSPSNLATWSRHVKTVRDSFCHIPSWWKPQGSCLGPEKDRTMTSL